MLGLEDVMLGQAIDDTMSMDGIVEVDGVIGDQVDGAVEPAKRLVVEATYSVRPLTEAPVVHVRGEEARQGVEVLGVDGQRVAKRQVSDGVAIDEVLEAVHESLSPRRMCR
jgi:hypothetical protein